MLRCIPFQVYSWKAIVLYSAKNICFRSNVLKRFSSHEIEELGTKSQTCKHTNGETNRWRDVEKGSDKQTR